MNPVCILPVLASYSIPRVSGDEPIILIHLFTVDKYSPRERG